MVNRRRLLALATGPIGVVAMAVALTASIGFAANLSVTSAHLTVLGATVQPPDGEPPDGSVTVVLGASADLYFAGQNSPTRVVSETLQVNPHTSGGTGSANHRQTFVAFDVDDIPPNAHIESAVLQLVRHGDNATNSSRTYAVQPAAAPWTDAGDPRPGTTGPVSNSASVEAEISWDVSAAIQAFADGGQNHGFRVVDTGSGNVTTEFRSHRYTQEPGSHPKLVVTYTVPEGE